MRTELLTKKLKTLCLVSLALICLILLTGTGCRPDPDTAVDPVPNNHVDEEEPEEDDPLIDDPEPEDPLDEDEEKDPLLTDNYFWPLLSHGQLTLSSRELIDGPSLLESDSGFVAEFTKDHEYSGRVFWLVDQTDVFAIEWLTLTFDVEYYSGSDEVLDLQFNLDLDNLKPDPGDEGLQEFDVDLVEEKEGFKVAIDKVVLAKEQESRVTSDPVDYVALDVEINVVDKP